MYKGVHWTLTNRALGVNNEAKLMSLTSVFCSLKHIMDKWNGLKLRSLDQLINHIPVFANQVNGKSLMCGALV